MGEMVLQRLNQNTTYTYLLLLFTTVVGLGQYVHAITTAILRHGVGCDNAWDYKCTMLVNGCLIHQVRPEQCVCGSQLLVVGKLVVNIVIGRSGDWW